MYHCEIQIYISSHMTTDGRTKCRPKQAFPSSPLTWDGTDISPWTGAVASPPSDRVSRSPGACGRRTRASLKSWQAAGWCAQGPSLTGAKGQRVGRGHRSLPLWRMTLLSSRAILWTCSWLHHPSEGILQVLTYKLHLRGSVSLWEGVSSFQPN